MSDRDVKSWMERISSDVEMLKRRLIRRPGGGGGGVPDPLSVSNLTVTDDFVSDGTAVFNQVDMVSGSLGGSPLLHESHNMRRFATPGELEAWAPPDGTLAYVTSENRHYTRSGGIWQIIGQAPYAMAAGSVSLKRTSEPVRSATVTLPVGRFTVPPLITLTPLSTSPQDLLGPSHGSVSESSFTVYLINDKSTVVSVAVHWHAIQMTPTSRAG